MGEPWPYAAPSFQHFLFNSVYRVHFDQKQQRWCLISPIRPALLVWPWTHHRKHTWGLYTQLGHLWHHALGQTGPWPHHLTCLLLSCLSTLSTAWSGAVGDRTGMVLTAATGMSTPRTRLWAVFPTTSSFNPPQAPILPLLPQPPVHNCNSVPLILKAWMTCTFIVHITFKHRYNLQLCIMFIVISAPAHSLQIRCKLQKNQDLCFCSLM